MTREQARRLREAQRMTERSFRDALHGMVRLKAALNRLTLAMERPLAVAKSKDRAVRAVGGRR